MGVTQRGNSFRAQVMVNGTRMRENFSTKVDAEAWVVTTRQALVKGMSVPKPEGLVTNSTSLSACASRCFNKWWKGKASEQKQASNIKQIEEYFGAKENVNNITYERINNWIADQKLDGSAGGTINRKLSTLQKLMRLAYKEDKLRKMPSFDREPEGENRIRFIYPHEEDLILATLESWGDTDLADAVVVGLDVGLRAGEFLKIKKQDVTKEGVILWDTKNNKPRTIPLTKRARAVLEVRAKTVTGDRLFPFKNNWYRDRWDRLRFVLKLDDVVFHTLRHTTASRLVQNGVPLVTVKEIMGHTTISTTMRYSHIKPSNLVAGIETLER